MSFWAHVSHTFVSGVFRSRVKKLGIRQTRFFRNHPDFLEFSQNLVRFSRIFPYSFEFFQILSKLVGFSLHLLVSFGISDTSRFIGFSRILLDFLEFFHFLSDYFVLSRIFSNPSRFSSIFPKPFDYVIFWIIGSFPILANFSIPSYSFNSLCF